MKKSIKKTSIILAMSLIMAAMSGCGNKENKDIIKDMQEKYSPNVTFNVEYEGIEYVATNTEITEDMIAQKVASFLEAQSESTLLTEGKVAKGDTINLDYVGSVDGVEFEGGSTGGNGTELEIGSGSYIDGFEEQIIGHKVGETFDITVTFPEDYGNEELNGKEAVFKITINGIKQTNMPELNEEFVQSNTTFKTVDEYKESVKNELVEYYKESDMNSNKSAIITAIIDNTVISKYPEAEIDELIDEAVTNVKESASSNGYEYIDFLKMAYGCETEEDFNTYVRDVVLDYLNEKMVVVTIAKEEKITVNDDDIAAFKKDLMDTQGITNEEDLAEYYEEKDIVYYALAEKVMDYLVEKATPVDSIEVK